ncbi:hypothetical protein ABT247_29215 [Kitasatospora sp. NPDC001539]|uniref:hypothetical protein n=1 Tax=Kitasatospora sp. NPDC001539 TaxID=3154384 RepID=UPI003317DA3F
MGQDPGFTVRPGELTAAGTNAVAVAGKVPEETAKLAEPSGRAAGGLPGWRSAAALQRCGAAWRTVLDGLAADMESAGGNLLTCARAYLDADRLPPPAAAGTAVLGTGAPEASREAAASGQTGQAGQAAGAPL